jgi:hypothetical protein
MSLPASIVCGAKDSSGFAGDLSFVRRWTTAMVQTAKEPEMEIDNDDQLCLACHPVCGVRGDRHSRFEGTLPAPFRSRHSCIAAQSGAAALFFLALLIGLVVLGGHASARDYGLVTMNFDLWCQEEQHLPAHRCDQRTAVDEKAFEDFQREISPYEAQNLRRAEQELQLRHDFMEYDPIDNPAAEDPRNASQIPLPRP